MRKIRSPKLIIFLWFMGIVLAACSSPGNSDGESIPTAPTGSFTVTPLSTGASDANQEAVLIVSSDYEPYTSSEGNGSGVVLEVIEQAFAATDVEVRFDFFPWKRCELYVERGEAFGAAPYFKTEERLEKYDFSDAIVYSSNRFFYNKEKFPNGFTWDTLEDFQGYSMGGTLGYWYVPAFERVGLAIDFAASDKQNLAKLIRQRIDFTVIDELTGMRILREDFAEDMDKIGMLEKPESFIKFYLLISRTYPNSETLTEKLNRGLSIIKENGTYQEILQQYNIPDNYAVP